MSAKTEESSFLDLARKQADLFLANDEAWCNVLVGQNAVRPIMVMAYNQLVRSRKLPPMEDLAKNEKQKAWDFAKEIAKGQLRRAQLIEIVQALLALEFFLNL